MPKYKLTYFNFRGLGEVIRYLFAYTDTPYEDNRIEWDDWQKNLKKTYEWGQMPVLEFDGQVLTQSCAIMRYLAKPHGLIAKDDLQAARCDQYVDCLWDFLRGDWRLYFTEPDKEAKAKIKEEIIKTHLPTFLGKINTYVKKHGGRWLVGDQLTWGDLFYTNFLELFGDLMEVDVLASFPELKAIRDGVIELPGIKEWRQKRPADPKWD